MKFSKATDSYEAWLGAQLRRNGLELMADDLAVKHEKMKEKFFFFRATYYRWAQLWPKHRPAEAAGPQLLAIGDLHFENFGTWRDSEGRLCWGVNDFDDAARLAYANDLVRLASSAMIVAEKGKIPAKPTDIAGEILEGYAAGIAADEGRPFVLEEENTELRKLAHHKEREPDKFWKKLAEESRSAEPPPAARHLLLEALPGATMEPEFFRRAEAGAGSLGRPRFMARATWRGGAIAREAKALVPAATAWLAAAEGAEPLFETILRGARRSPDPFLKPNIREGWVVRRLAPRSSKLEEECFGEAANVRHILNSMGAETANVHLGSKRDLEAVRADVKGRKADWLQAAAETMVEKLRGDFDKQD